jgi:hypothetical protein
MSTVTATISAPPGVNITLTSAPYYILGSGSDGGGSGMDPGGVQYSRLWATSPYVVGAVPLLALPGIVQATMKVYTYEDPNAGGDQSQLQTDLTTLIGAYTEPVFTIQFNIGDATYKWQCYCADYQIDAFPMLTVFGYTLGTTFQFPRQPIALEGPV